MKLPHQESSRLVQREQGAGSAQPDAVLRSTGAAYRRIRRVIVAVRRGFAKEPILTTLVAAFVLLQCVHPQPWRTMPAQVDWQTVMTLAGLLMLAKAVEYSGFLTWASHRLVRRIHSERGLALWLVLLAAGLSTLLTNDVALFVVVPLMLSLHALVPLPVGRLVVLVALAVNAGSILTPFGNPQNLFLWQRSGESFLAFIVALAPLCAALMAVLVALTLVTCRSRPLVLSRDPLPGMLDWPLFCAAAVSFAGFVALADAHHAGIGLALVALGLGAWRRDIVMRIDWLLLLIFVLMFVVLRSAASLPTVHQLLAGADLTRPGPAYLAGALVSQLVSNVPAAIMLAEFSQNWRALAFGVSVGGFGIAIGSLANLVAMRLVGAHGCWWRFHAISLPFYVLALLLGGVLL
ncbi:transporter, YbiR family [Burkholderia sp. b14]|nr:anion permease [Mycetohabitans sp. B3]MCG1017327.1 anion permease [Mycetohabitans sp. B4]MCG1038127.1 anion permease [Mycetohabitans sp. B7]SIT71157.1 transporter, YbiR family [Burkholderia sp. b13]SIT76204.1 transporter, YbiR family [Burkholderia sp. b14]